MFPPRQCLRTNQLPCVDPDLRLEGDDNFAAPHRSCQFALQHLFQMNIGLGNRAEMDRHGIRRRGFRQRKHRFADQGFLAGIAVPDRDTGANGRIDRPTLQQQVTEDGANQIIGKIRNMVFLDICKGDQEILAIQTGHQIRPPIMALCILHQPAPDDPQQLVPGVPAERCVDHPEIFDTDRDERQLASACQFVLNPRPGRRAVLQAGQQVPLGPVIRFLALRQIFYSAENPVVRFMKVVQHRPAVETVRDGRLPRTIAQSSHGPARPLLFLARQRPVDAGYRIFPEIDLASGSQQVFADPVIGARSQGRRPLQIRRCQQRLLMNRPVRPAPKIFDKPVGIFDRLPEVRSDIGEIQIMGGA